MREFMKWLIALAPPSMILATLVIMSSASAWQASDIFSSSIPVSSSGQVEYRRAATEALIEVLSKSSGRREGDVNDNSALATDLKQAYRWVAQYQYDTVKTYGGKDQLMLKISFPEKYVMDLIRLGRLPYWPQNRPQALLFVVGQSEGKLELLNDQPAFRTMLEKVSNKFGLAPIYPSQYVAKRINLQHLWALDRMKVQLATEGLSQDAILIVRLRPLAFNTVDTDWLLIENGVETSGAEMSPSPELAMESVYTWLVGQWARHQTIDLKSHYNEFVISVNNIKNYEDSLQVLNYLESLKEVKSVFVSEVQPQHMNIAVSLNTDWDKFVILLKRSKKLSPELNQKDSYMHYFWWNG